VEFQLLSVPASDAHHHAAGVARFTGSLSRVLATLSVIVQDVSNITALKDSSTGVANEFLDLIEEEVVKLLTWQRVPGFQSLNVFLWERHADTVAFWR
jgi:hypothetical protein